MRIVAATSFIAVFTACGGLSDEFKDCGCSDPGEVCVMDPFDGADSFANNIDAGTCRDFPADCSGFYDDDEGVLLLDTVSTTADECRDALCPDPFTRFSASSGGGETFVQCEPFDAE